MNHSNHSQGPYTAGGFPMTLILLYFLTWFTMMVVYLFGRLSWEFSR
jgi:hypothetical protein